MNAIEELRGMNEEAPIVVRGGGFTLLTADPVVVAIVRRCADLAAENDRLKRELTGRYRTLRRDVAQIKRQTARWAGRWETPNGID